MHVAFGVRHCLPCLILALAVKHSLLFLPCLTSLRYFAHSRVRTLRMRVLLARLGAVFLFQQTLFFFNIFLSYFLV
jgi:hypothetical protein